MPFETTPRIFALLDARARPAARAARAPPRPSGRPPRSARRRRSRAARALADVHAAEREPVGVGVRAPARARGRRATTERSGPVRRISSTSRPRDGEPIDQASSAPSRPGDRSTPRASPAGPSSELLQHAQVAVEERAGCSECRSAVSAGRSSPMPNAKPCQRSGSMPQLRSTLGWIIPQPPHSSQPPRHVSVHLGGGLGEREEVRAEAQPRVRAEQVAREGVERALEVGEGDALVRRRSPRSGGTSASAWRRGRGGRRGPARSKRNGGVRPGHRADLHGRGVRAQQVPALDEEGVLGVARRMVVGEVERAEVVPVGLDLGAVLDRVAEAREERARSRARRRSPGAAGRAAARRPAARRRGGRSRATRARPPASSALAPRVGRAPRCAPWPVRRVAERARAPRARARRGRAARPRARPSCRGSARAPRSAPATIGPRRGQRAASASSEASRSIGPPAAPPSRPVRPPCALASSASVREAPAGRRRRGRRGSCGPPRRPPRRARGSAGCTRARARGPPR